MRLPKSLALDCCKSLAHLQIAVVTRQYRFRARACHGDVHFDILQRVRNCCRVWSVAHSPLQPNWTASGADRGVVRLWHDRTLRGGSTTLVPAGGAAVCGVEFCSEDANLLAVACADTCSYIYDLRNRCRDGTHCMQVAII